MIRRLYLNNCFRHQDTTFTFEKGLTGIIGPNESGKSLIVEMIRYSLFGTKALRGKADDYKKLHVELDFDVRGETYSVVRKAGKVTLSGAALDVSGTKPVDEAIRRLLGYDLSVFDVANACNQGNIEALSSMTPTARKAMVDKTVGLTALDGMIRFAGAEGLTLKREGEAMQRGLSVPVEPAAPDEYLPAADIQGTLNTALCNQRDYNELRGFLSRAPLEPVAPEACPVEETEEELLRYVEAVKETQRRVKALQQERRTIAIEEYSAAQLDAFEAQIPMADRWAQKERLLAQGHICCPECNHSWPVANLSDDIADAVETAYPELNRAQIREHRTRVGNAAKITGIDQAVAELEEVLDGILDRSEDLKTRQAYEAREGAYQRSLQAYQDYHRHLADKQARFAELEGIDEVVAKLQASLQQAQIYERDLARFQRDQKTYETKLVEVEDMLARGEDFLKAREIIQALKVSVKTHLLPSLNKVASILLGKMTGGERYLVEVDEDFEIIIDGQPINTLSGSGKAVANLAIRIALGQILTNRVFSIFMADEVDAAMDDERAAYTADALRHLTDMVGQVILVTHKRPETDRTVELTNASLRPTKVILTNDDAKSGSR